MNGDDLCYLSATQAMALFHDGRLSPVELLEAVIARYESIAGTVNPFAYRYFDEARRRARESEAKFARKDGRLRRLEGIPMAVKENSPIQGKRMTSASLIDTDRVAGRTDPAIERLMRAGANVFARTTMPEFAWLYATHSRLWGVTRNPWRLDVSVGGLIGRLGGRAGRRRHDHRDRRRQHRVDPPARLAMRHCRVSGALRGNPDVLLVQHLRPSRAHDPHGRGCPRDGQHHGRAPSARPQQPAQAAHDQGAVRATSRA